MFVTLTGQQANVTVCEGNISSVVEVQCHSLSSSSSLSTYRWRKNGTVLNITSNNITFDTFGPSDVGTYQCEVGTFCGQIQLRVGEYSVVII